MSVSKGRENIENTVVNLELPYGLSFSTATDRVYLGTIKPGYSYNAVFLLHADEDIRQTVCTIDTYVSGISSIYGIPMEMRESVQIGIERAERIEIRDLVIPDQVNAAYDDGSRTISFLLENKGNTEIKDIEISAVGDGLLPGDFVTIDQLPSLAEESVILSITPEKEGEYEGNIVVCYTNEAGTRKELIEPVKIKAFYQRAEINHELTIVPGTIEEALLVPDWIWGIVTFSAIVGAVIILRKIKRAFLKGLGR